MKKKYALVTGRGKRKGSSVCKALAKNNWHVIIHFNTSREEAEKTLEKIRKCNGKANLIKADLSKFSQVNKIIPQINKKFGNISLLINNASIFNKDTIKTVTSQIWDNHLEINLKAPFFLSKAFSEQLPKGENGVIINFLDQSVLSSRPDFISYSVSKNSLWYLTKSLAQALSPKIRVCAIGPGPTLKGKRQSKKDFETQKKSTLLKTGPSLEEINNAINFILRNQSYTGQMLILDGGEHLKWRKKKNKRFIE